jgi:hypothetical protein
LVELAVQHPRRQKRGVLGATEREPEPYSMYGEDRSDRATTKSDAFHGASTNPANLPKHLSFFFLDAPQNFHTKEVPIMFGDDSKGIYEFICDRL